MANTPTKKDHDHEKKDDKGSFSETASELKHKAGEAASAVAEKAKDIGSGIASTASQLGSKAAGAADSAAATVGSGAKSLAGTVRENLPHSGMMGGAAEAVAGTLESAGRYLQEEGVTGAADDLVGLIRRHPVPAVLVGIGIGFLIGAATCSMTSSRS